MSRTITFDNGGTRQIRRYRFTDGTRLSKEAQATLKSAIEGIEGVFRVSTGDGGAQVEIFSNEFWSKIEPDVRTAMLDVKP